MLDKSTKTSIRQKCNKNIVLVGDNMKNEPTELNDYEKFEIFPNSAATNAVKMLLSSNNKGEVRTSKDVKFNKKEHFTGTEFIFNSRNSVINLTVEKSDLLFSKQDKKIRKVLNFLLQQYNSKNKSTVIKFCLKDLVDRNIYKNIDSARNGLKNCMKKLMNIKVSGTIKNGKKEIVATTQVMFIGYEIRNAV